MTLFAKSENCLNCDLCNSKSEIFQFLSEEDLTLLNLNRYEVSFKAGENIIKQGITSSHLIMLTSGIAKFHIEGLDNRNIILELLLPFKIYKLLKHFI